TPPTAEEVAVITASATAGVTGLAGAESPYRIRRVLAPVRDASGDLLGLLFVFGLASSIFLAWWVTRRLNRVARAATAWSRGDFTDRIADHSRDELGGLSSLLDRM